VFAESGLGGGADVFDVSTGGIHRLYDDVHGRLRYDIASSHNNASHHQLARG